MANETTRQLPEQVRRLYQARRYSDLIELIKAAGAKVSAVDPELALMLASSLVYQLRYEEAKAALHESWDIVIASRDSAHLRQWQYLMGVSLLEHGELATAQKLLTKCLISAEAAHDMRRTGRTLNALGIIASIRGDTEESVALYTRALAVWQVLGDHLSVGMAHHNLALLLRECCRLTEACDHSALAQEYLLAFGTSEERVYSSAERAMLKLDMGDEELAENLARASVVQSKHLPSAYLRSSTLQVLGAVLLKRYGPTEARPVLNSALKEAEQARSRLVRAEINAELAVLEMADGNLAKAEDHRRVTVRNYEFLGATKHIERFMRRFEEASAPRAITI